MRRNLAPQPDRKRVSLSNRQTIASHLQKIGTMVNAPSRTSVLTNKASLIPLAGNRNEHRIAITSNQNARPSLVECLDS